MSLWGEIKKVGKRSIGQLTDPKAQLTGLATGGPHSIVSDVWHGDKPPATQSASDQMGQLYRDEFDNWMTQFFPVDQQLMGLANSNADNLQSVQGAHDATVTGFQQARQADTLQRQGLGTALSPEEQSYIDNKSQRAEKAGLASNMNSARLNARDRDMSILSGSASAGLSGLAGATPSKG